MRLDTRTLLTTGTMIVLTGVYAAVLAETVFGGVQNFPATGAVRAKAGSGGLPGGGGLLLAIYQPEQVGEHGDVDE